MATEFTFDIPREVDSSDTPPFAMFKGPWSFPESGDLIFGTDFAHSDFVLPIIRFAFFDAKGNKADGAPTIYMKMGGTFQSTLSNGFSATQNMYGNPSNSTGMIGKLGQYGEGFVTAMQKQALGAVAAVAGAVASGGQSGKQNVEFLERSMFNNFQQLVYNGPNFRSFSLPFAMKPTSYAEAQAMRNIIASFRIASSPSAGEYSPESMQGGDTPSEDTSNLSNSGSSVAEAERAAKDAADATLSFSDYESIVTASYATKTLGYPNMCRFQLLLYKKDGNDFPVLFESDLCVIENVAVDYGGQNKMTFFEDTTGNGQYYPTDVTLNVQLKETSLITTSYASLEASGSKRTIL